MSNRGDYMSENYEMDGEYEEQKFKIDEITSNKKNMPIKQHMRKIEELIAEIKTDLQNNRQGQRVNETLKTFKSPGT